MPKGTLKVGAIMSISSIVPRMRCRRCRRWRRRRRTGTDETPPPRRDRGRQLARRLPPAIGVHGGRRSIVIPPRPARHAVHKCWDLDLEFGFSKCGTCCADFLSLVPPKILDHKLVPLQLIEDRDDCVDAVALHRLYNTAQVHGLV